jgi:hypothetical protein
MAPRLRSAAATSLAKRSGFVSGLLVAAVVVAAVAVPSSARAATLSCAHPTTLTGYEGTRQFPPYAVQQGVWTQQGRQTMKVCSESEWTATVNQKGAPETGVKTYPNSARMFTDWSHCSSQPRVGSFTKLQSSFAERSPKAGSWDAAYDVFVDGSVCGKPTTEIMVWTHWRDVWVPRAQLHPVIGHVKYDLYHSGHYFQFRRHTQAASTTVDFAAVFRYMQRAHLLSSSATLQFVEAGTEVLTTRGRNLPFSLTRFSVRATRASRAALRDSGGGDARL